jgi:hypothetical protein
MQKHLICETERKEQQKFCNETWVISKHDVTNPRNNQRSKGKEGFLASWKHLDCSNIEFRIFWFYMNTSLYLLSRRFKVGFFLQNCIYHHESWRVHFLLINWKIKCCFFTFVRYRIYPVSACMTQCQYKSPN